MKVTYLLSFFFFFICKSLLGQDFEVAPVLLEYAAEPGDNQVKIITIKNHSNVKTSFILSIADFLPSSTGEKKIVAPNSTKRSCANWLNINPTFFELNPGDEIPVQIAMLVPSDQYSAAWCMVYVQPTTEQTSWSVDKNLGTGIKVNGRIGVMIYQSPKSNNNYSLKISNITEVTELGDKDRSFSATVENLGEKITKARVYLIVANNLTLEEKQYPSVEIETFPKMSRNVVLKLPNDLKTGKYTLSMIIDYGPKFALEGSQLLIEVK